MVRQFACTSNTESWWTMAGNKPLVGKIVESSVKKAANTVSIGDPLSALKTMVESTTDYLKLRELEQTKRSDINARRDTEIEKIRAASESLRDYLDRAFAERRHHTDELFARYDDAIERGDGAAATVALKGVVEIAQASPLGNLADLSLVRQALFDTEYVHEL